MERKYNSLREKISAEKRERMERYTTYSSLFQKAWKAGTEAATSHQPRPMIVTDTHGNVVEQVNDGPCGFAWLNVPGNTSFGKWLRKSNLARPDYPTGLSVWIDAYGQSYERKRVHASTMAAILQENGIECVARGRLD